MYACATQNTVNFHCLDNVENGDPPNACGSTVAYFYFISFMLIVSLVFLNLFIAIILEGFFNTTQADQMRIGEMAIDEFKDVWKEFDPDGTGYIDTNKMNECIKVLVQRENTVIDPKFHKHLEKDSALRDKFIAEARIPVYNTFTKYNFFDVLDGFARKKFQ